MSADPFAADDRGRLYVVTTTLLDGARSERLVHAESYREARAGLNRLADVRRARLSDVARIEGEST